MSLWGMYYCFYFLILYRKLCDGRKDRDSVFVKISVLRYPKSNKVKNFYKTALYSPNEGFDMQYMQKFSILKQYLQGCFPPIFLINLIFWGSRIKIQNRLIKVLIKYFTRDLITKQNLFVCHVQKIPVLELSVKKGKLTMSRRCNSLNISKSAQTIFIKYWSNMIIYGPILYIMPKVKENISTNL